MGARWEALGLTKYPSHMHFSVPLQTHGQKKNLIMVPEVKVSIT